MARLFATVVLLFVAISQARAAPPGWACGRLCDYYANCKTECASASCNAVQKNVAGEILVLDTHSFETQACQGCNPPIPSTCCQRCQEINGCNAWSVCTNKDGCGSGCQKYMEQFKGKGPISYDSNLPQLAFGNFKNCVGDKWPANMCSLKVVKDVKNVTYYPSSPKDGWVSGVVHKPFTDARCDPTMSPQSCKACIKSKDPAVCVRCAIAAKRIQGPKDCVTCANLATGTARSTCVTCATAKSDTPAAKCAECLRTPWEGKETQPLDVAKVGQCFTCVAAAATGPAKAACANCYQSWKVKDDAGCSACVVNSSTVASSAACPACYGAEVVGKDQCLKCGATAKKEEDGIGCGSCSSTNNLHPSFTQECQACVAKTAVVDNKSYCYNLERDAKNPTTAKLVTDYYKFLTAAKDRDAGHACWMCYQLGARFGGSGDAAKCYSCMTKVKESKNLIYCSHCWSTNKIQSGRASTCQGCLAGLKAGEDGARCADLVG